MTASANIPFLVALALVFILGVLETISLLLGGSFSLTDHSTSDFDAPALPHNVGVSHELSAAHSASAPHAELPTHAHGTALSNADHPSGDLAHDGLFSDIFQWLHLGHIPAMIVVVLFLLSFGTAGLALQSALFAMTGMLLPAAIAVVPAFVISLPATRVLGGVLKPILPRDETEAVSRDSFVGCEARITMGTARAGAPAEARVQDRYGRSHYILVEPDKADHILNAGTNVLILSRSDAVYRGIEISESRLDD